MALRRDPTDKTVWVNPQWNGRDAATFACVIGVSAYDFLDGSDEEYNLPQLSTSALTAYKFFQWLANDYHCDGKPLAKCWLLLSPTSDERDVDASIPETTVPHLEACTRAVNAWYSAIEALPPLRVRDSRALFFFSGHGLEMDYIKQILLPADYRPSRSVHLALSSYNIVNGLWKLPLSDQVFFLDACRNDHRRLREQNPEGVKIFNTTMGPERSEGQSVVIYAAGPGGQAWQPDDPRDGVSVFGRVLDDALRGAPGMDRECHNGRCWVTLPGIKNFLKPRVRQALLEAGLSVGKRIIQAWEEPEPSEMCEVGAPPPMPPEMPREPRERGDDRPLPFTRPVLFADMATVTMPVGWTRPAHSGDREALRGSVQGEFMSNLLWDGRVFDFRSKAWTSLDDPSSPAPIAFHRIARTRGRTMYQLEVEAERPGTFWLELNDHLTSERAACMLPGAGEGTPRYTIDLTFDSRGGAITAFDVILSTVNDGLLGTVAEAWKQADEDGINFDRADAIARAAASALPSGSQLPLAATVAALMLLRSRRRAHALTEWVGRLVDEFPAWPDGYVICAEQLLRTGLRRPRDVVALLLQLERTGLPRLGESTTLAARQIDALLDVAFDPEGERGEQQADQHRRLLALRERFARVARVFSPHGLCTTLMGAAEMITPGLLDTDDDEFIRRRHLRTGPPPEVADAVEVLGAAQFAPA